MSVAKYIFWKESRMQLVFWAAMSLFPAVIMLAAAQFLTVGGIHTVPQDRVIAGFIFSSVFILTASYPVVVAGLLFADEKENGTAIFLNLMPGSRTRIWLAKAFFGSLLVAIQAIMMGGISMMAEMMPSLFSNSNYLLWFVFLIFYAELIYGWALVASVQCSTVLKTAGLTALYLVPIIMVPGMMSAGPETPVMFFVANAMVLISGPALSWWIYAGIPARKRRSEGSSHVGHWLPSWFHSILWLCWQQGKVRMALLLVSAILLGFLVMTSVAVWPIATLVMGIACGIEVFTGEQQSGGREFLGRQRISATKIWLAKAGLWFSVGLISLMLCAFVATLVFIYNVDLNFNDGTSSLLHIYLSRHAIAPEVISYSQYVFLWSVYAFPISLLCGQLLRKSVVAIVAALGLSILLVAPLIPTFLLGGWNWLQLLVIPCATLFTSWWLTRSWLGERFVSRRTTLTIAMLVVVATGWTTSLLCYRAFGIADPGEPFDVQKYLAETPAPVDRAATRIISNAVGANFRKLQEDLAEEVYRKIPEKKVEPKRPDPNEPGAMGGEGGMAMGGDGAMGAMGMGGARVSESGLTKINEQINSLREKGWPKDDERLNLYLDLLFSKDWYSELEKTNDMPLAVFINPRTVNVWTRITDPDNASEATRLIVVRAKQMIHRKEYSKALSYVKTAFSLSNHARNEGPPICWLISNNMDTYTLAGYTHLLKAVRSDAALLKEGQELLEKHLKNIPPFEDAIKVSYLSEGNDIGDASQHWQWHAAQFPWEKEREKRIQRWHGNFLMKRNQVSPAQLFEIKRGVNDKKEPVLEVKILFKPPAYPDYVLRWLHFFDGKAYYLPMVDDTATIDMTRRSNNQVRYEINSAIIETAMARYQLDHMGRKPENLQQLVPNYLAEIPNNPFTGLPFVEKPLPLKIIR